jgi:hypothetical protein
MTRKSLSSRFSLVLAAMAVTMLGAVDAMAKRAPGTARHRSANHGAHQNTAQNPPQSGQTQIGAAATPRVPAVKWEGPDLDAGRTAPAVAPSLGEQKPKGYIGGTDDGSSI